MNQISFHKNNFRNLLKKNLYLIQNAFSFKVWNQFYLENDRFVAEYLPKLKNIYKKDKLFQKYIKEDFNNIKNNKFKFEQNQIDFFLEEHLMFYLISKKYSTGILNFNIINNI